MPKTFTYQEEGLTYIVELTQVGDNVEAEITVTEGAMDVNAVYFGDDDYSGESESLGGPLNMNGAGSQLGDETVQWDAAQTLSDPGLGPEGEDKETYIADGETLTFTIAGQSLDEIDIFGVRATSTTTESGSIKGVSEEDPEDPPEEEPEFNKVAFFGEADPITGAGGFAEYVEQESLPDGSDGSFADYASYFEDVVAPEQGVSVSEVDSIGIFEVTPVLDEDSNPVLDEEGVPQEEIVELFSIVAPEGGFADADEMIAAYDEAVEGGALDDYDAASGAELIASFALPPEPEDDGIADTSVEEDEDEMELV